MPIAFHPPVDRPIEAPQPSRAADDSGSGDAFAALLVNAGKAPAAASAEAPATDGHLRKPRDDPPDFDPLAAFAAWAGAQPLAPTGTIRVPGARADDALPVTSRSGDASGSPVAVPPLAVGAERPMANTAGATRAQPGNGAASTANALAAINSEDDGVTAAPPRGARPTPDIDIESATAKAQDPALAAAPSATAPFAQAAALMARALDAKPTLATTLTRDTATQRRDGTDAASAINLGATVASAPLPPAVTIAQSVGAPGFATEVAGQMAQLVHINADRAQLHVHPADMGPIDVTLQVRHAQVTVTMVAADPQTRAALELALPQLRDLLANQGLALTNASVNDQAPRDSGGFQSNRRAASSAGGNVASIDGAQPAATASSIALRRLVDLYA